MKDIFVLEWSYSTNNFHIQPLDRAMADAQMRFIDNKAINYAPIYIGTFDQVSKFADHHRRRLYDREQQCETSKAL